MKEFQYASIYPGVGTGSKLPSFRSSGGVCDLRRRRTPIDEDDEAIL